MLLTLVTPQLNYRTRRTRRCDEDSESKKKKKKQLRRKSQTCETLKTNAEEAYINTTRTTICHACDASMDAKLDYPDALFSCMQHS
jgi:hypothetical protein